MKYYGNINLNQNELQNAVLPLDSYFPANPKIGLVNHNLGKFVTGDVFVDDGAGRKVKAFPLTVVHVSETQLKITFSSPKVGYVKVQ